MPTVVPSTSVTSVVLDASALLAVMNSEPGADIVRASLVGAFISAVNYSEVMKKTIERSVAVDTLHALVKSASLEIVPFDTSLAEASAELFPATKAHGMSFADRACLALGIQRGFMVLTAERRMRISTLPIKVKLIRNAH
jgi:PIN domain nuclease of toxin-antitoxin system